MSDTTRKGLVTIANLLGKTKNKIFNSIGDNIKTRGSRLEAETAFTRLKTSINFHDYDLAKKSTDGYTEPRFLTFDEADPIGFGIQGGEIYPKRTLSVPLPTYILVEFGTLHMTVLHPMKVGVYGFTMDGEVIFHQHFTQTQEPTTQQYTLHMVENT